MEERFIILPNKLVWSYTDDKTYLEIYGDKIVHIFTYLELHENKLDKTVFNIKNLIEFCGIAVKRGKGKSIEQFKNILVDLQDKKIIESYIGIANVGANDIIECIFNMNVDKEKGFFSIKIKNYLKIMNSNDNKLNKLILLKIYYYINSRLSRREIVEIEGKKMSNDIQVHGGKAESFYDTFDNISKHLKITENTFNKYIKALNELELLYFDNIGMVAKNGRKYTANNVYCIDKNEIDEALEQSRLYYLDNKYTILDKKTEKNIRVANGLKGKIKQEESLNKDTSKLKNKLDGIELNIKKEKCAVV